MTNALARKSVDLVVMEHLHQQGPAKLSEVVKALRSPVRTPTDIRAAVWKLVNTGQAHWHADGRVELLVRRINLDDRSYDHVSDASGFPPSGGDAWTG